MKNQGLLLAILMNIALALTACGAAGNTMNLEVSDLGVTPKAFTVDLGAEVTLVAKNSGTAEYDRRIRDFITIKQFPSQSQWSVTEIAAGTTKSVTFTAPSKPASYQISCGVTKGSPGEGFPEAMSATLEVK